MANALAIALQELGTVSADGQGEAIDIGELRSAVTAELVGVVTTGELSVWLEQSPDGLGGWTALGAVHVANVGEGINLSVAYDRVMRFVRVAWRATAAQFSVIGEAHQLLARREDLSKTLPASVLSKADEDHAVADALITASCDGEDEISRSTSTPIQKWPHSVRRRVASIAKYYVMVHIGFDPEGTDKNIVTEGNDAKKWLREVGEGKRNPPGLDPKTNLGVKTSSGDAARPDCYPPKFTDNFGDF